MKPILLVFLFSPFILSCGPNLMIEFRELAKQEIPGTIGVFKEIPHSIEVVHYSTSNEFIAKYLKTINLKFDQKTPIVSYSQKIPFYDGVFYAFKDTSNKFDHFCFSNKSTTGFLSYPYCEIAGGNLFSYCQNSNIFYLRISHPMTGGDAKSRKNIFVFVSSNCDSLFIGEVPDWSFSSLLNIQVVNTNSIVIESGTNLLCNYFTLYRYFKEENLSANRILFETNVVFKFHITNLPTNYYDVWKLAGSSYFLKCSGPPIYPEGSNYVGISFELSEDLVVDYRKIMDYQNRRGKMGFLKSTRFIEELHSNLILFRETSDVSDLLKTMCP